MRPGTLSLALGALLVALALGTAAYAWVADGGFDLLYALALLLGLPPLALGLLARRRRRTAAAWFAADVGGLALVLVPVAVAVVGTGNERDWTHVVTWSVASLPGGEPGARYVRLDFADFPGHFAGLPLDPWSARLRGREGERLQLETRSTEDFGRVRGVRALALDGTPVGEDGAMFLGVFGPQPERGPWDDEPRP